MRALVDTGCTQTLIAKNIVHQLGMYTSAYSPAKIITADGSFVKCSSLSVPMVIQDRVIHLPCLVLDRMITDFDLVLGMDVVRSFGGLRLASNGPDFGSSINNVQFGLAAPTACEELSIDDPDFVARFDGSR